MEAGGGVDDAHTGLGDADNDRTGSVMEVKSGADRVGWLRVQGGCGPEGRVSGCCGSDEE